MSMICSFAFAVGSSKNRTNLQTDAEEQQSFDSKLNH